MGFIDQVHLLDDAPVEAPDRDQLGVASRAEFVAGEIVRSAGPMVFGVFGGWGSGKTSFCRMVVKRAVALGGAGIRFYHLRGSQHELAGEPDASLMHGICAALCDGNLSEAHRKLKQDLPGALADGPGARVGEPGAIAVFEDMLAEELERDDRLIVIVDDLDRCSPEFVLGLWNAIRRFHTCPQVFFLVAADKEIVLQAMERRLGELSAPPSTGKSKLLDKYLRWYTELPPLPLESLGQIVRDLYEDQRQTTDAGEYPNVTDLIMSGPTEYINLIWTAIDASSPTMRALKRLLNAILPQLADLADKHALNGQRGLEQIRSDQGFQQEANRIVKEALLDYVLPAATELLRDDETRFRKLERLWTAMAEDDELYQPADVRALLRIHAPELLRPHERIPGGCEPDDESAWEISDDELQALTAIIGLLQEKPPPGGNGGGGDESPREVDGSLWPRTFKREDIQTLRPPAEPRTETKTQEADKVPQDQPHVTRVSPQELLDRPLPDSTDQAEVDLQLLEMAAEAVGSPAALPLFNRVQQILDDFYPGVSPIVVGNLAVEAERCGLNDIATDIHHRQLEAGVFEDFRLASQFVSFLIDEVPERHEEAHEWLQKFNPDELSDELRARWLRLSGQLMAAAPEFGDASELIEPMKSLFQANPTWEHARDLLVLYDEIDAPTEDVLAVAEGFEAAHPEDERACARVRRGAGDALADRREDAVARSEAMKLYRSLEGTPLWGPETWHNLATLLYSDGVDTEEALRLWAMAYADRPQDYSIRRSFAQSLAREGRDDEARQVLLGQPFGPSEE